MFSTIICSEFEIAAMNHEIDSEHKFVSIASFKRNFYNNSFDKFLQIYLYRLRLTASGRVGLEFFWKSVGSG